MSRVCLVLSWLLVFTALAAPQSKTKVAIGPLAVHAQVVAAWPQTERALLRQDWGRQELERRLKENMAHVDFVSAANNGRYFLIATVRMAEYCQVRDPSTSRQAWLLEIGVRLLLWDKDKQQELARETCRGYAALATMPADVEWETMARNAFTRTMPVVARVVEDSLARRQATVLPKWEEAERRCLEQVLGKLPSRYQKTPVTRSKTPTELFTAMAQELSSSWPVSVRPSQIMYRSGEAVTATLQSRQAGHGYILYQGASGTITMLLPNRALPTWWLEAGASYAFPDKGSGLTRLKVKLGDGVEKGQDLLYLLVTEKPLNAWQSKLEETLNTGKNYATLTLDDVRRAVAELQDKRFGAALSVIEIVK